MHKHHRLPAKTYHQLPDDDKIKNWAGHTTSLSGPAAPTAVTSVPFPFQYHSGDHVFLSRLLYQLSSWSVCC